MLCACSGMDALVILVLSDVVRALIDSRCGGFCGEAISATPELTATKPNPPSMLWLAVIGNLS